MDKMKIFLAIWVLITLALTYEYLHLEWYPDFSLWQYFSAKIPTMKNWNNSLAPGRPISLWLGWSGLGLMVLTNLFILRKRVAALRGKGRMRGWLDFHIFCGLMGPTLIIFHCNFKVNGLVAISFWSMIIVAISGIIGNYFYSKATQQIVLQQKLSRHTLHKFWASQKENSALEKDQLDQIIADIFAKVGLPHDYHNLDKLDEKTLFSTLGQTIWWDLKSTFGYQLPACPQLDRPSNRLLHDYINQVHNEIIWPPFKRLLGYWHTFHLPFTIFMYLAGVIHIIVAFLFQVAQ